MTIFFSADLHFCHRNILMYTKRHQIWTDVVLMNNGLINNWNSVVNNEDSVYILGDVMMGNPIYWESILSRLNGKLHLVAGNHDKKLRRQEYAQKRFEWIKDYHELKIQDAEAQNGKSQLIVLQHCAPYVWHKSHRGSWALSGHSHGSLDAWHRERLSLDVGVDAEHAKYFPIAYEQIKKIMKHKEIKLVDHHGSKTKQRNGDKINGFI